MNLYILNLYFYIYTNTHRSINTDKKAKYRQNKKLHSNILYGWGSNSKNDNVVNINLILKQYLINGGNYSFSESSLDVIDFLRLNITFAGFKPTEEKVESIINNQNQILSWTLEMINISIPVF